MTNKSMPIIIPNRFLFLVKEKIAVVIWSNFLIGFDKNSLTWVRKHQPLCMYHFITCKIGTKLKPLSLLIKKHSNNLPKSTRLLHFIKMHYSKGVRKINSENFIKLMQTLECDTFCIAQGRKE